MAHIEADHFDVRPAIIAAGRRGAVIQRTHNMLVMSAIGAMMIVVVGALFLTMF